MKFYTTTFTLAILTTTLLIDAQLQVPCIFFFGDSQFDNGNNNDLISLAKVNYRPYGIDYDQIGPSGRFANGPIVPDYLAQLLGHKSPIPPFVNAIRDSKVINGVNYASGGAGILDSTGKDLVGCFTMNEQLLNHDIVIKRIVLMRGSSIFSVKNNYLNKCLHVINIGSNDYLNNYLLPLSPTRSSYTPDTYAQLLIQKLSKQLWILYNQGARKMAVYGVGSLGCLPQQIAAAKASECVDSIDNIVRPFDKELKDLIDNLNNQLHGAQLTYINATSILSIRDVSRLGIRVVTTPCCTVSSLGLCIPHSVACRNRSAYAFWGSFHPTSVVNQAAAARAYSAAMPTDVYPVDIWRLVQQ